jgi:hypothetical protein
VSSLFHIEEVDEEEEEEKLPDEIPRSAQRP